MLSEQPSLRNVYDGFNETLAYWIGQHWDTLGKVGQHWAALGNTGQHWKTLGKVGQHWAILGSVGQHLAEAVEVFNGGL